VHQPPLANKPPMKPTSIACHECITAAPEVIDTKPPMMDEANWGMSSM